MKKISTLILSVLLAFTLIIAPCSALAETTTAKKESTTQADDKKQKDVTPVILVPGVGSSALYKNPNTASESSPVTINAGLFKTVMDTKIVSDVFGIVRGKNVDPYMLMNKLSVIIKPFTVLNPDKDGNSTNNIGINSYWEEPLSEHIDYITSRDTAEPAVCRVLCDTVGAENVWIYNYDFRLDVVKDADELSKFIDVVKKKSKKDKVILVSASLGTSVVSAYIDKYQSKNDIKKTVFLDGAFQGTSMGKLFKKDILVDKDAIDTYIKLLSTYYTADTVDFGQIGRLLNTFDKTYDNVLSYMQTLTSDKYLDDLYLRVILPVVGNMPAMWECIPYDDFNDSVVAMMQIGWLDPFSGLYKDIMTYHGIQGRLENNLNVLKKKGVEVAIICGYGMPQIPFTSYENIQSDMLIDTCYASFGATTKKPGETLENATSPDKMIDSSTCAFEENTWFIQGVQHMEFKYGTDVNKFVAYMVTTNDKLNIKSVEKSKSYSQFMVNDKNYKMTNGVAGK